MGRALQGFSQEQGKGGVSCRPGESRPPGRCVARWPLGLPPAPGHRWAAAGWSLPWCPHLASGSGSWRVSCMYPSGTAQMLPSGSYVPPGFPGMPGAAAAWTLCSGGHSALGPAPRGVCSPRVGGEPPCWRPRCLTFVTVLAGVAHFTGAAVGPVAGQAVAAASTGV